MKRIQIPGILITFLFTATLLFLIGTLPLFIAYSRTPQGSVYPLIHTNAPHDYNLYLSVITQGKHGDWLMRDPYTSEHTNPGIFYFFYILVGKFAALFHLWPPYAYHIARIVSVELFFIAAYFLYKELSEQTLQNSKLEARNSKQISSSNIEKANRFGIWDLKNWNVFRISDFASLPARQGFRISLACFFLLTASFNPLLFFLEPHAFKTTIPWWHILDSLERITWLPHYISGHTLLVFTIFFLIRWWHKKHPGTLIAASGMTFLTGIFLPAALLPLVFGIPVAYAVSRKSHLPGHILILLAAGISYMVSLWQTKQGFPWDYAWSLWDNARWNMGEKGFDAALLIAFAPLIILSFPAIIRALRTREFPALFFVFWALMPVLLLPVAVPLGIGKIRLISSVPFVPFAFLLAQSAAMLKNQRQRTMAGLLYVLLFIPGSGYILYHNVQAAQTQPIYTNMYIAQPTWDTLSFIEKNIPKRSVVLSNEFIGNIFPAYAPVISYFGHINQTKDFFEKQKNVALFYSRKFSVEEARQFLAANTISYVYFGSEERQISKDQPLAYPFLKEVYKNTEGTVYEVVQ